MRTAQLMLGSAISLLALGAAPDPAAAKTLRYAFQGDLQSLDPYALNETFTLGFQGNIYEGLTRRDVDLQIEPALAERWEILEPTRWRFHLRQGVKFHNGNDFTADDVVFSAERVRKEGSDLKARLAGVKEVVKVDDHTVDFVTEQPNPILHFEWDTWYIMDQEWADANGAGNPTNISEGGVNYASLNANGTGPFQVTSREPDVRTTASVYEGWWDEPEHNLQEVVFQPIAADATRVAALLSGEMDMVDPVPIQDIGKVDANPGTRILSGPELRTIFLGMDQMRDELLYSDVKGKNPFRDRRIRLAMYQALDLDAIHQKLMRGQSRPSASMVAPGINGFPESLARYAYDPDLARGLLAEAGYPEGFRVTMDCPNDRYVNDEAICQAVVGMLGRIGIQVDLLAQTKSKYFAKVLATGGYDTSFYLLGWTPGSFDSWNALFNLAHSQNQGKGAGAFNLGGYSNARIDRLSDQILVETDLDQRAAMIAEAWQILHDEVAYLPLHQQALAWGVKENVHVGLRADNQFLWRFIRID